MTHEPYHFPFLLHPEDQKQLRRIEFMLRLLLKGEDKLMSAVDDLNGAVVSLASGFQSLDTAVQAEIVALQEALSNSDQPAIEQAVANISTITNKMATDAAALTSSIPAATTVPPPPAVTTSTSPDVTVPQLAPVNVTAPSATPPATSGNPPPTAAQTSPAATS
jgi:hypothetical protein